MFSSDVPAGPLIEQCMQLTAAAQRSDEEVDFLTAEGMVAHEFHQEDQE